MSVSEATRGKLPVLKTVGRAYAAFFANFGTFVRISWLWLTVVIAATWWSDELFPQVFDPSSSSAPAHDLRSDILGAIANLLRTLFLLPFLSSIAVNWHRLLLKRETPSQTSFIRLDSIVWSYTAMASLLEIAAAVSSLLFLFLPPLDPADPQIPNLISYFVALLLFGGAAFYLSRMFVGLAARALERPGVGFAEVLARTHGNTWRINWGYILCFLPVIVLWLTIWIVWPGPTALESDRNLRRAYDFASTALSSVAGVVAVGFLSYAYEHFFPLQSTPTLPTTS